MRYGPWPRRGRLLRHLWFFFLLPARPQSWRTRPCQGGTHCVQWGGRWRPALTWTRRDYLALLEKEEKRRSDRPPQAAARGRPQLLVPRRQGGRSGEGVRTRSRCPRGTQPGSKRPIDQQSVSAGRGLGVPHPQGMRQPTPALPGTIVPCLHAPCLLQMPPDGQDRTPAWRRRDGSAVPCAMELEAPV